MLCYICLNCKKPFENPAVCEEPRTCERIRRSPCCYDGFSFAIQCVECGALIAAGSDQHGLCKTCAKNTVSRLTWLLWNEFTEAQREVLNDSFDGVPLTNPDEAVVR